jgi:hypothetical protein
MCYLSDHVNVLVNDGYSKSEVIAELVVDEYFYDRSISAAASIQSVPIDHLMAQSIIDRLGYTLRDLTIEYGDVCFENGEITHELHYSSFFNSHNIMGYVKQENGIYYTNGKNNYQHAEIAALDLLDRTIVEDARYQIEIERACAVDYD